MSTAAAAIAGNVEILRGARNLQSWQQYGYRFQRSSALDRVARQTGASAQMKILGENTLQRLQLHDCRVDQIGGVQGHNCIFIQ